MTPILQEIEMAMDIGQSLRGVYARLRSREGGCERTGLLRQADELAGSMGSCLRRVASLSAHNAQDEEVSAAIRELGGMIEQVMVEEREYRMASGACSDEEDHMIAPGGVIR